MKFLFLFLFAVFAAVCLNRYFNNNNNFNNNNI